MRFLFCVFADVGLRCLPTVPCLSHDCVLHCVAWLTPSHLHCPAWTQQGMGGGPAVSMTWLAGIHLVLLRPTLQEVRGWLFKLGSLHSSCNAGYQLWCWLWLWANASLEVTGAAPKARPAPTHASHQMNAECVVGGGCSFCSLMVISCIAPHVMPTTN